LNPDAECVCECCEPKEAVRCKGSLQMTVPFWGVGNVQNFPARCSPIWEKHKELIHKKKIDQYRLWNTETGEK